MVKQKQSAISTQSIEQEVTNQQAIEFSQELNAYAEKSLEHADEWYGYPIPTFKGFVSNSVLGRCRCSDVAYALNKKIIIRRPDGTFAIQANGYTEYSLGEGKFKSMPNTRAYGAFLRLWEDREKRMYKPAMDQTAVQELCKKARGVIKSLPELTADQFLEKLT